MKADASAGVRFVGTAHGPVALVAPAEDEVARLEAGLHPDERRHAAGLGPGRRRDFVAGRAALRAALARAGLFHDAPLLPDDRGAPRLPAGACGSISHKRGRAAAVAAPDDGATLGVDLERLAGGALDVSRRILTARELAGLAALEGPPRAAAVALRFCLKEAIYKAVDPFVRRYVAFAEVELELDAGAPGDAIGRAIADEDAAVAVRVVVVEPARLPVFVEASARRLDAHWLATARAWPR